MHCLEHVPLLAWLFSLHFVAFFFSSMKKKTHKLHPGNNYCGNIGNCEELDLQYSETCISILYVPSFSHITL